MDNAKNIFAEIGLWIKSLFVSVNNKEPKFLTFAKKDGFQTVIASILCALCGILLGYIILLCINAQNAGTAIGVILKNFLNFKNNDLQIYYLGSTLAKTVPLIMCGLSVLFAYKAGLFNIGVGGQYCIGICVTLYSAIAWQCPWYVCCLLAILAGALWGAVSGIFKALFNVNEVIACIMTNWIALYLTNMALSKPKVMDQSLSETYNIISAAPKALMPSGGLSKLFNNNQYATLAIVFAVLIAIFILILLNKTTFGYELKATGNNKFAAKYAGMKDKRNIVLTMAISGALAGLGAAFYFLTGMENWKTSSSVPTMGFNGIAVAFLGGLNPLGLIFAAFFVQNITMGGGYIDTRFYNPQIADLIVSIIIYLCAFVLFFKQHMKSRLIKTTGDNGQIKKHCKRGRKRKDDIDNFYKEDSPPEVSPGDAYNNDVTVSTDAINDDKEVTDQ